ncbi:hypothetical protein PG990_008097 [Apiospora arundinis]
MKSLILALFAFLLCLGGASAGTNLTQLLSTLPDGGYIMDMSVDEHGMYSITDLNGTHIPGSPFTVDSTTIPLSDLPLLPPMEPPSIPGISGCVAPYEYIDWDDWRQAGRKLGFWCSVGNMVPSHKILNWIIGDSQAYICNYAGEQNCRGDEYWRYMRTIADNCGYRHCGWFLQGSGDKTLGRGIKDGKSSPFTVCSNV